MAAAATPAAGGAAAGGGWSGSSGLLSGLQIASGLLNKRKDQSGASLLGQMAMNPQIMQGLQGAFRQQPTAVDPAAGATPLPPGQAPGGMSAGVRNPEMGGGAGVTPAGGGAMQAQPAMAGPPPGITPAGGIGSAIDGRMASNWSMDGDRPRWRAATQPLFGGGAAGPGPAGAAMGGGGAMPPAGGGAALGGGGMAPTGPMPPVQPLGAAREMSGAPNLPGVDASALAIPAGQIGAQMGGGGFQMSSAPKFPPFGGAMGGGNPAGGAMGGSAPRSPMANPPVPASKPGFMGGSAGPSPGAALGGGAMVNNGKGPDGMPLPPNPTPTAGANMGGSRPPPGDPSAEIARLNAMNPGAAKLYAQASNDPAVMMGGFGGGGGGNPEMGGQRGVTPMGGGGMMLSRPAGGGMGPSGGGMIMPAGGGGMGGGMAGPSAGGMTPPGAMGGGFPASAGMLPAFTGAPMGGAAGPAAQQSPYPPPPAGMDPQHWARLQQTLAQQMPGLGGGAF